MKVGGLILAAWAMSMIAGIELAIRWTGSGNQVPWGLSAAEFALTLAVLAGLLASGWFRGK